jgi:hypothetical protein
VRKQAWCHRGSSICGCWIAGVLAIVAGVAMTAVWMNRPAFAKPNDAGQLPAAGRIVYFDAFDWVGKPLPLLGQIDIGDRLSKGRWIIVIHNSQCRRCRQVVPEYEQLATQWKGQPNVPGIALVDVVLAAPPADDDPAVRATALRGRVVSQREWFIITPAVLAVENGMVKAVNDEEPAAQWVASVFKGQ